MARKIVQVCFLLIDVSDKIRRVKKKLSGIQTIHTIIALILMEHEFEFHRAIDAKSSQQQQSTGSKI